MKRLLILLTAIISLSTNSATARQVVSINDNWRFYFSSENSADYARTISIPHTWANNQSMQLLSTQPTTANYMRSLYAPEEWSNKRVFIKFYGVESVADLLINGQYVGEHRGGSTAFTFEISQMLAFGDDNRIHVIVNNAPQNDILPTSREDNIYGGIYRDVEIIVTDKTAISPLYYGSDGVFVESRKVTQDVAEGVVKVHLISPITSSACQLKLTVFNGSGTQVYSRTLTKAKSNSGAIEVPFIITKPQRWSQQTPHLYRFVVESSDGSYSDSVSVVSGFRSIDYSADGFISINGTPTQFRGVSLYHDYPHVGGAASIEDIERDMALINELGANAIRSVVHPHHPELYNNCDREGIMVWIDFPLVRAPYLSEVAYYPTERFRANGLQTANEIVAQNYNHPSVVMWGIFSMITSRGDNPIPYIKELNALTKSLDSTRPTVAVSDQDGEINTITDLIVWKQRLGWEQGTYSDVSVWSNILHTRWNNFRSAVAYGEGGRVDQQSDRKGYKNSSSYNADTWFPEGRQRELHEEYASRLLPDTLFWGVCIENMFDYKSSRNALGENNKGLISYDRRRRKDIFYLYKAQWNPHTPTLHIADKRSNTSSSELHTLKVYASDTTQLPTLITELDTIEMRRVAPAQYVADSILLEEGINRFVVRQGSLVDSTIVIHQGTAKAATTVRRQISSLATSTNSIAIFGDSLSMEK